MWLEHLLFGAETDAVLRGGTDVRTLFESALKKYGGGSRESRAEIIDNIGKDNEVKQQKRSKKRVSYIKI